MLPILEMVVQRFTDGPNAVYKTRNSTFLPPKVMASFTNDGQINQLAAVLGIFEDQPPLPGNMTLPNRKFKSSRITPMRGTIAFESLSCPTSSSYPTCRNSTSRSVVYMRIRLNEVVYPVLNCTSGPGSSCPLSQYQSIVKRKLTEAGDFAKMCNVTGSTFLSNPRATVFFDNTLPWATVIKP
jgi:acid phosphatase